MTPIALAVCACLWAGAVLGWAVTSRLQALRDHYKPSPTHAEFKPGFNPDEASIAVYLRCDTCGSRTPHEDHQDGAATCVICHLSRPTEAVTSRGQ